MKGAALPERDGYIPGVPCWVDTSHPDPEAAVAFYNGLFGWDFEDVMPPGAEGKYLVARIRGGDVAAIGSTPAGAPSAATWNTYIWVDSADTTASKVLDAGGTVLSEPFDVMDAGRMAVCADPDGAAFCVWQARQHRGARVVNEPGAVVLNGLSARNKETAKSFYGAVFGWQTLSIAAGEMWALPGYGNDLERSNPGLRRQMRQLGAPEGFEDVVASLQAIAENGRAAAPHWDVTFATDDADAIARRATELGGDVVLAPFDAPWSRVTAIADPQGATFLASKFAPENKDVASRADAAVNLT
jgi:uncharacterized protein